MAINYGKGKNTSNYNLTKMVNYFSHIVAQQRLLEMPPCKLMLDYVK